MTDEDLIKKFQQAVKDEVRPLKEVVEVIKNKVDKLELPQMVITGQVRDIKEQQSVINEKLDDQSKVLAKHTRILENQLLPSVVEIENKIVAYSDMYKMNNDNAKKLEKRVVTLEEDAGITPSPEFTLVEVS